MLTALPAKSRLGERRLKLRESAMRTIRADFLGLPWRVFRHKATLADGHRRLGGFHLARRLRRPDCTFDGSYFGLADEGRAFLDDEACRFQVTLEHRAGFQFATLFDGDVSVDLAVNRRRFRFDLAADLRVLADRESSGRSDFTFNFSVNDQIVEELDGSFDFHVGGEDVLGVGIGDVGHD